MPERGGGWAMFGAPAAVAPETTEAYEDRRAALPCPYPGFDAYEDMEGAPEEPGGTELVILPAGTGQAGEGGNEGC